MALMVSLFKKTKKAIQNTQTYCYLYTNHRSFKCSTEKHFRITHSLFANPIILSAAETKGNKGVKKKYRGPFSETGLDTRFDRHQEKGGGKEGITPPTQ